MIGYAALARQSLTQWLERGLKLEPPRQAGFAAGCFVSLFESDGGLRGCIGTIQPVYADLVREIVENAVSAGTRDPRFPPVSAAELQGLAFEVSVLKPPEPVGGPDWLDPRRFGVVVSGGGRRGVLLPDIEGVDTVAQQIAIAKRKAGIGDALSVELSRFEVEKHHERP